MVACCFYCEEMICVNCWICNEDEYDDDNTGWCEDCAAAAAAAAAAQPPQQPADPAAAGPAEAEPAAGPAETEPELQMTAAEQRDANIERLLAKMEEIEKIPELTVKQLKDRLRQLQLPVTGNKDELIARLLEAEDNQAVYYEWLTLYLERDNDGDEKCSICMERFHNNKYTTPCGHAFHFACLLKWTTTRGYASDKCPNCRSDLHQSLGSQTPCHTALSMMPAADMQCAVRALAGATGHAYDMVLARLVQQNDQLLFRDRMNANGFTAQAIILYLTTYAGNTGQPLQLGMEQFANKFEELRRRNAGVVVYVGRHWAAVEGYYTDENGENPSVMIEGRRVPLHQRLPFMFHVVTDAEGLDLQQHPPPAAAAAAPEPPAAAAPPAGGGGDADEIWEEECAHPDCAWGIHCYDECL